MDNGNQNEIKAKPSVGGRIAFATALVAFAALHVLAMLYFSPSSVVLGGQPIVGGSFSLRAEQTREVLRSLDKHGQWWSYDPRILAGAPSGTAVDTNSRAWQLMTYGATKLGANSGTAFNVFVWLAHLSLPLCLFFCARLFGLPRPFSLLAAVLGAAIWYFDGYAHWCWYEGMVDWALAAALVALVTGATYAYIHEGKTRHAVLLLALVPILALIHVYAALALAVPFGYLWWQRRAALSVKQHAVLSAVIAGFGFTSGYFVYLGLRFRGFELGGQPLGRGTPEQLLFDLFGLNADRNVTGAIGLRQGFRLLVLGSAGFCLWQWKKNADRRVGLFFVTFVALLAVAYFGGLVPGIAELQPYRFVLPVLLLAVIPAAGLFQLLIEQRALRGLSKPVYALLIVTALAVVPKLGRDVFYFVPAIAPQPADLPEERPHIADMLGFGSIGYPRHREFRHAAASSDYVLLASKLDQWSQGDGRILVESTDLAEYLASATDAQVLGADPHRNIAQRAAFIYQRFPNRYLDPDAATLAQYFETYAVGWIISVFNPLPRIVRYPEYHERLFERSESIQWLPSKLMYQRLGKTRQTPSYFAKGQGNVNARSNRIEVAGTDPQAELVLRFHWLDTLLCQKDCRIERAVVPDDEVGFIRVSAPHPASFAIINGY